MIAPDFKPLEVMPCKDVATFWFNYWNDLYPVTDLKLEFETEGYIKPFAGYADYPNKKTAFNLNRVHSNEFTFYSVARHEHAHQLLAFHGYDHSHTLHFCLVDAALEYAFDVARGKSNPKHSIRFYDLHEDRLSAKRLNIRAIFLAVKRLSRYVDDIELLLAKAEYYAELISNVIPDPFFNYEKRFYDQIEKSSQQQDEIFKHWENSDIKLKSEIKTLEADVNDKQQALVEAHEQYTALNKLQAKWQGAFMLLLIGSIYLITK